MPCHRVACACLALTLSANACSIFEQAGPEHAGPNQAGPIQAGPEQAGPSDDAVVFVIGRGWHTDIGLPVEEITGPLAVLADSFPGVRVLTFGFGERQFLVNRKETFGAMLRALLPSQSALLVTALGTAPEVAFGPQNVVVLSVSRTGLKRIEASIWQEFEHPAGGAPMRLAEGPYPGSVFYAAVDTYDGLYTCNTWTAGTLRAGGVPMAATGVLFAGQVMGMARWIAAHRAPPRGAPSRGD